MHGLKPHGSLFIRIVIVVTALCFLELLSACSGQQDADALEFDQSRAPSIETLEKVSRTESLGFVLALPGAPSVLVGIGDTGAIVRSEDGGQTWAAQDSKTMSQLLDAVALGPDGKTLVAVGSNGTIVRSEDSGQTWTLQDSKTTNGLWHIVSLGTNGKVLVAVGDGGTIVRSDNSGQTWAVKDSQTTNDLPHAIALGTDGKTLVAVGDDGTVTRSEDGGQTWAIQKSGTTMGLWHVVAQDAAGKNLVAVGILGTIVRSEDGGRTWTVRDSQTDRRLVHVLALGTEGKTLVAVGGDGSIVRSEDGGQTWTVRDSATTNDLSHTIVLGADGKTLVAAGERGTLVRSGDGGQTWAAQDSTTTRRLWHIAAPGKNSETLVVAGEYGTIVRSQDKGQTWSLPDPQTLEAFLHLIPLGSDGNDLMAMGSDGTFLHSEDAGQTWAPQNSAAPGGLSHALALGPDRKVLVAVGSLGAIVRSQDRGKDWVRQASPAKFALHHVIAFGAEDQSIVAFGNQGTIVRSENGGLTWAVPSSTTKSDLFHGVASGKDGKALVAVGETGSIVRSEDGGQTWAVQDSKTTDNLKRVFAFGKDGKVLIAVGSSGTIVRSEDAGQTWTVRDSTTASRLLHATGQDTDGKNLVVVGENGTILHSKDGGQTWVSRNSTTKSTLLRAIVLGTDGKTLVAVGEFGTIVRSEDGGQTWVAQDSKTTATFRDGIAFGPDHNALLAVGAGGVIVRTHPSIRTPIPTLTSATATYTGTQRMPLLKLAFATPPSRVEVQGFSHQDHLLWKSTKHWLTADKFLEKRLRPIDNSALKMVKASDGKAWEVTLDPAMLSAEPQQPLFARVVVHGPGFQYTYPGPDQFFEIPNHPAPMPPWLKGAAALAGFASLLLLLSVWRPLLLLRLASQGGTEQTGAFKLLAEPVNWALQLTSKVLMPILTRQPWVLDAWVTQHHEKLSQAFRYGSSGMTEQSSSYEPLPVRAPDGSTFKPDGATIRSLLRSPTNCFQIIASGGAGKTRLAIQIGQWLFAGEVTPHPGAALLVDDEFDDLWKHVQQRLVRTLGVEHAVPTAFLAALVRKGRLWIIVDRLSERGPKTQAAFAAVFDNVSPHALICTARRVMPVTPVQPIVIEPLPLDKTTLLGFLESQMRAEGASKLSLSWKNIAALVDRLAQQITLGGRELPVTPLLVKVFVRQAIEALHRNGDQALQDLPSSIPEAYFRYVERLDATLSDAEGRSAESMRPLVRKAATLLARIELGADFRPKPVPRARMEETLAQATTPFHGIDFVSRFLACGLLSTRQIGAEARLEFLLDPLAECLAAHEHALECGSNESQWRALVQRVANLGGGGRGFMLALHMNHAAYRHELGFPEIEFPGADQFN